MKGNCVAVVKLSEYNIGNIIGIIIEDFNYNVWDGTDWGRITIFHIKFILISL